jgi:Fic family protein
MRDGGVIRDAGGVPVRIVPGALRDRRVAVGRHSPPEPSDLASLLNPFEEVYDPQRLPSHERLLGGLAAHHRLAWIHPFVDGNGRVTRLFTDAYLIRARVGGVPLWTISRGLARRRDDYMVALTWADQPRRNDHDGRGPLSMEGLQKFCHFMLDVCLDQVAFMTRLLDLSKLEGRITAYVERRSAEGELRIEARHILSEALRRGEIARGDAVRVSGLGERVGRSLLSTLLREGLLEASGPKRPVRLGFPARVLPSYLPELYPAGVEEDLRKLPPPSTGSETGEDE